MSTQNPKFGAIASPRSALGAAMPYVVSGPTPENFLMKPAELSWWGNEKDGDCVTAEEAFAKACSNPEIFIPEGTVVAWAKRHGVFEGAALTDVLTWMQTDGFDHGSYVYCDGGHFWVDWTEAAVLRNAIVNGPVKIGVAGDQLLAAWRQNGGRSGWFGTGFVPESFMNHCVAICGYGSMSWLAGQLGVTVPAGVDGSKPGYAVFTWCSIGILDVPSLTAVTHEGWLRQPTTLQRQKADYTLGFIKTSNTPNGHVEVHLASGRSGFMIRTLETATTFANESDGVWQLLPNLDLAFIKTDNTPNGHVEVHIASHKSNYQTRTLETATTFANENDGTWQLLPNLDLAFIKTSNTPDGHVEVHIASRKSDYRTRILETATTFANESDGVWQLLPNLDLAFIKTSNTPDGHVEVHIASHKSDYRTRTFETATTFANEDDGTWEILPNLDLAFIKTDNTPDGHVEVHIASRKSNYQTRIVETATTFGNETDGVWGLLVS